MRCWDCSERIGDFDPIIPVLQRALDSESVEPAGYMHLWHMKNQDDSES